MQIVSAHSPAVLPACFPPTRSYFGARAAPHCNYPIATKADISEDVPPLFQGILLGQVIKGGAKKGQIGFARNRILKRGTNWANQSIRHHRPLPPPPAEGGAKAAFVVLVYYSGSLGCGETYADRTEERRGPAASGEVTYFCSEQIEDR